MAYCLHTLPLLAAAASVELCFNEDYAVCSGLDENGVQVLPTCTDVRYLVPCGAAGLYYLPALGDGGGRKTFTFARPVVQVYLTTTSANRPVPVSVFVPTSPPAQPEPAPSQPAPVVPIVRKVNIPFTDSENAWAYLELLFTQNAAPAYMRLKYGPSTENMAQLQQRVNILLLDLSTTDAQDNGYQLYSTLNDVPRTAY